MVRWRDDVVGVVCGDNDGTVGVVTGGRVGAGKASCKAAYAGR